MTLSGLVPGQDYELILDSAADIVGRETEFIVNGVSEVVSPTGNPLQGLGDTYAEYMAVADALGDITVTFLAAGGNNPEADLNGIQLLALPATAVPEPSTLLLLAGPVLALLLCRRRKQTSLSYSAS